MTTYKTPPKPPKTQGVLVFVGLPGAGKSTWSCELKKRGWTIINQDRIGSKAKTIDKADKALARGESIVIDRMNLTPRKREVWVRLAEKHGVDNICAVYFNIPVEECKQRVMNRKNHPVGITGEYGVKKLEKLISRLEPPSKDEGFTKITRVA